MPISNAMVSESFQTRNKNQQNGLKNTFEVKKSLLLSDNGRKTASSITLDFKLEENRLKSFTNFRSDVITPEELAKAGFYFLNRPGKPDLVKCAFCPAEICDWEEGDDALEQHIKWSPTCPFVRRPEGRDVCGNGEFPNSLPNSSPERLHFNSVSPYAEEKIRLDTFANWPENAKVRPEVLAKAGFFYRGMRDQTICFSCGKGLEDWKEDDDPWEEHAHWYPHCSFVISKKGRQFVEEIQKKYWRGESNKKTVEEPQAGGSSVLEEGVVLCKICDVNERNIVFMPCKHMLACESCSKQFNKCPVCRRLIQEKVKVYVS